jgi:hypothetical protein
MASFYYKITLLCVLLFSLCQCTQKQNQAVSFNKEVEDGDIILRKEGGFISSLFSSVATQNNAFSHVGILVHQADGSLAVIHCELKDKKELSSLRKDSIETYLCMADTFAVYRVVLEDVSGSDIVDHAQQSLRKGYMFDMDFDANTDSVLYCTEFVAKTINKAAGYECVKPTKYFAGKVGYSIDDIITFCKLVD